MKGVLLVEVVRKIAVFVETAPTSLPSASSLAETDVTNCTYIVDLPNTALLQLGNVNNSLDTKNKTTNRQVWNGMR